MSYGIIFWGSSSHANNVFILQKRIIGIITNTKPRDSCREVFKNMEIMTFYSQYIYSLILHKLITGIYLILIVKFINIKLEISIIYTPQQLIYQSLIKELIYLV